MATYRPNQVSRSNSKTPPLSAEVQQYKLLKSQGILGSLPTEQSGEASTFMMLNLKSQEDEKKSPKKNLQIQTQAKVLDKIVQYPHSTTPMTTNSTAQGSPYASPSSPPWIRETLAHYLSSFHKSLVSTEASPLSRGSSERVFKQARAKSPSISSTPSPCTPMEMADMEILTRNSIRGVQSVPVKSKASTGRQSVATGTSRCVSAKSSLPNTERPKSGLSGFSQSRSSLTAIVVGTPKTDREAKAGKESRTSSRKLSKEVEEWRAKGGKMADSYDSLNKKLKKFMTEKVEDKTTIVSLKEQVGTLKSLLTKCQSENMKLRENLNKSTDSTPSNKKNSTLRETVEELKDENSNIKKTLEFLKDENDVLKKALNDVKKYQDEAEYYKKLAESKFKECSTLAEEIICLRTDLDRCNSNLLRAQKAQNMNVKVEEEQVEEPRNSNLRKEKGTKAKKGVSWKDEIVEKSPRSKNGKVGFGGFGNAVNNSK